MNNTKRTINIIIWLLILSICHINYAFAYEYEYGNPTPAEQAHLEAINRARANPEEEAQRLSLDSLYEGTQSGAISGESLPPLTLNSKISQAAKAHSQEMADNDYFDHYSLDGSSPFDRMTNAGYSYQMAGENIAAVFSTGKLDEVQSSLQMHDNLFVDKDYPDRGHRVNILTPNFKEIGIGLASGISNSDGYEFNAWYIDTDFGTSLNDSRSFIVGVVYEDKNHDGFYTAGEGVGDIDITVIETGYTTKTASAGGYGIPLNPGNYTLVFEHYIAGQVVKNISLSSDNVKIDVTADDFGTDVSLISDNDPGLISLPEAPVLSADINNMVLTLSWTQIDNADGYYFIFAPYPNADYVNSIWLGNILEISFELWQGAAYYIAIAAENSAGIGNYSNILYFTVP